MNPAIFRNYDIRGVVPDDLSYLDSEVIGKAFGTYIKSKYGNRVVIGHDNRKTSPEIKDKFVYGLMSVGCHVTDVGMSLTPIISFLSYDNRFDVGVIVTASHNPSKYNGFRFCCKNAFPIFGEQISEIKELSLTGNFEKAQGTIDYDDLNVKYVDYLASIFSFKTNKKVLLDCGNGTSSVFASKVFTRIGIAHESVFCNLDNDYPHGVPNPENALFMKPLSEAVVQGGYDVGFAYDTDTDRFGFVDEKGRVYSNDKALLFLAEDLLKKQKGKIIFDVKCTEVLPQKITEFGGEPVMMRTGHVHYLSKMREEGVILGGEYSGHLYYGHDYFGYDDGIFSSLKVLEVLSKSDKSLSELMDAYPKTYNTGEIEVPVIEAQKAEKIQQIKDAIKENPIVKKIVDVDGVRIYLTDTDWVLIRSSNTMPVLTMRLEASTQGGVEKLAEFAMKLVPELKPEMLTPIHFS